MTAAMLASCQTAPKARLNKLLGHSLSDFVSLVRPACLLGDNWANATLGKRRSISHRGAARRKRSGARINTLIPSRIPLAEHRQRIEIRLRQAIVDYSLFPLRATCCIKDPLFAFGLLSILFFPAIDKLKRLLRTGKISTPKRHNIEVFIERTQVTM